MLRAPRPTDTGIAVLELATWMVDTSSSGEQGNSHPLLPPPTPTRSPSYAPGETPPASAGRHGPHSLPVLVPADPSAHVQDSGSRQGEVVVGGVPAEAGKGEGERFCDAATARAVGIRVFARIMAVVAIIVILRLFPGELAAAGRAYLSWIHGFGHVPGPFVFFAVATTFCSVSPTGYFMNVAAGVTYGDEAEFGPSGYAIAFVLSYLCTLCGSAVNLALVRGCMGRWRWLRRRFGQPDLPLPPTPGADEPAAVRGTEKQAVLTPSVVDAPTAAGVPPSVLEPAPPVQPPRRTAGALRYIAGLETALRVHPMRIVILLRLPFLGNGALNYWLSFNSLGPRPIPILPMMLGNAIGMLPGSILFALLGRQIRSLASLIAWGTRDPSTIAVFVGILLALLGSIGSVLWVARRFAQAERKAQEEAARREKEGQVVQVALQVGAGEDKHADMVVTGGIATSSS